MPLSTLRRRTLATVLTIGALSAPVWLVPQAAQAASSVGTDVEDWAGDGDYDPIIPGPALQSPMYYPTSLASDRAGTIYVAFDPGNSDMGPSVAKITRGGVVSYLLNSTRTTGQPVPGPALASPFEGVTGLAAAPDGTVYVASIEAHLVVKISPSGTLSVVAGNGSSGTVTPGPATSSPMDPGALALGPDGSLYIADESTLVVSRVSPGGTSSIVAGNGALGTPTTGGPATSSSFNSITDLALDDSGDLFVVDQSAACVLMVDGGGDLDLVAGSCGSPGTQTLGPAASSQLGSPGGMALDPAGDLYIADSNNRYINRIADPDSGSGTLSVVAGNGNTGALVPGPATSSPVRANSLTMTRSWTLYFAHSGRQYIHRLTATPGPSEEPLELTATPGNARATLSFLPPDDDGNSAHTGYEYSIDGGTTWLPITTTANGMRRTATVTGLTNGLLYTFQIRLVTSVGPSPESNDASATPAAAPPAPPSWFRDVVTPAQRAKEIAVPQSPRSYRGPQRYTRARNRAYTGQLAMPVTTLRGRALSAGQAAVLAGDGLFDFNSSRLTTAGKRQIRLLAPTLRNADRVRCEGYTDYGADLAWEYRLSRARAKRVCAALAAAGVDAQFVQRGYGPQRPVVVGGPRHTREENRRVVVLVLS